MLCLIFTSAFAKPPKWMDQPAKWCKKSELCAVGEGESYAQASADSRQAIAKIFETRIQSKFTSSETLRGSATTLEMKEEISEFTEGVISGIEVLERYETDNSIYVISSINKRKTARVIKGKIDAIDESMKSLADSKRSNAPMKLKKLHKERFPLSQSYEFLTNMKLAAPVSLSQIAKLSKQVTSKVIIHVAIKDISKEVITSTIQDILVAEGYKLAATIQDKRITHTIKGTITSKEEYIKVKGFTKYSFLLEIYAVNKSDKKTGALSFTTMTVGRSYEHTIEKAIPRLREYVINNIDKLNFE